MLKFLIGLLASVSSVFTTGANKSNMAPPLNTAIIAYQETYYAPVAADLGNFPWAKQISEAKTSTTKPTVATKPTVTPPPPSQTISTSPPPPPAAPPPDPYLANPEPIVNWYIPVTLRGNSINDTNTLPEMTFDREFWRIEVLAYWAPGEPLNSIPVEKDYFKLEVYEKGTDKLVYTMTSGNDPALHKFQAFKKPGTYYFKTYLKSPSQFEITFTYSGGAAH